MTEINKKTPADYVKLALSGFTIGVANVIPGVSGGTMAFLLGIYEELIEAIRKVASWETVKDIFTFKIKKLYETLPWKFLVVLGIGLAAAIFSCAKLFTYLVSEHAALTFAFFFGLVAASVLVVLKKVKKWSAGSVIMLIAGAVAAYLIVNIIPTETPNLWWVSFLAGMIAICAMILPGISGSFLLLVFGQFRYVWGSVAIIGMLGRGASAEALMKAVETVVFFGAGCIVGLGSFVHLLNYLFKKCYDPTVAALIGFMAGSLWKLWPWKMILKYSVKTETDILRVDAADIEPYKVAGKQITILADRNIWPAAFDRTFYFAVALALVGFAVVFLMEYFAEKEEKLN